ncbi:MAG: hypothetical protein QM500_16065 [Methylococcales bacterium]
MSETEITVDVVKKIQDKLDPYLSESLRDSQLFIDLADIHEICRSYQNAIDRILLSDDREMIAEILNDIDNELFVHLPYHFKSLKKLLPDVIDEIESVG